MTIRKLACMMYFASGLSGCLLPPTEAPDCTSASGCYECSRREGCGFCEASGRCVPGSSFGPDEASCPLASWRFASCDGAPNAVGDCHEEEDCNGCLYELGGGEPGCQWCPGTGECLNRDETCAVGAPHLDYDTCRVANCAAQTTCGGCTSMGVDCRWCDVGGGVCTESYECDPHYRFGDGDRCPPPNDCSDYFGCDGCLGQPGCGWCDAPGVDGYCVAVDGFGDYAGWCTIDLYLDACPG